MLSAVLTALMLCVMLLIVGSFIFSAWREQRRHLQVQAGKEQNASQAIGGRTTVVLQLADEAQAGLNQSTSPPLFVLPHAWHRRRTFVSAGFLLMLLLGLFVQSGLADGVLQKLDAGINLLSFAQHTTGSGLQMAHQSPPEVASQHIVRIDSARRDQYYTSYQWLVWSYSSCSGISMEEVMNAYGHHYIAADVLQVEANMGIWNVQEGLTGGETGMARAAAHFGFKADPHPPRTLQDLIRVANAGFPVIVGIPDHILVVRGGDSNNVYLVDSAPANRKVLSHQQFLALWDNFSVLLTPQ